MRAARLFLGLSASFAVIASVASGCGSSTSNPPVDSGTGEDVTMEAAPMEATVEAAVEAAAPEAAVDAACVPDASLATLTVPDASIGDSGVDVGACLSCFEAACPSIVATCDQSCACISAVQQFGACIGMPESSLITCASGLTAIPGVSITSLACALGCTTICGVMLPGGDSGSTTDSSTATDGPTE